MLYSLLSSLAPFTLIRQMAPFGLSSSFPVLNPAQFFQVSFVT